MKKIYTLLTLIFALSLGSQAQVACNASFYGMADTNNFTQFAVMSPQGYPYSYRWDFGDGSPLDSGSTTYHQYNNSGIYNVTLYVDTSGIPCGSRTTSIYVNYCGADFTHTVYPNRSVTFNSQAYHPPFGTTLHWDFGDGNGSTQSNPSHTYANYGTYYVTQTVMDSIHQVTCSFTDSVVIAQDPNCNASFYTVKDTSKAFGVILYNNSSNLSSHNYFWDFGDGQFAYGRTPSHNYQNFGTYYVCLSIMDSLSNCFVAFCDSVGMDSMGNLKSGGFGLEVRNEIITSINENEKSAFEAVSIYPNPANSQISVDLRGLERNVNIRLMDLSGKLILSQDNVQNGIVKQMDISHLSEGFYFLTIEDGNNRRVEKIAVVE